MLKIQRASAGSGKTYTLTQNFILNLIARQTTQGKWILRTEKQIEDSLQHILAITFTNKATNEMKQRILNSLSRLSKVSDSSETDSTEADNIPYLSQIKEMTGASFQDIGIAADQALRIILNNYSLFRISTIDSFFQEILRTFAYEANINENYQLEIDTSYVTDEALNSAIQKLDLSPNKMGNSVFWLKTIMRDEATKSQQWNPFNKKTSPKSVYSRIRRALKQLENENFKDIKDRLYAYFDSEDSSSLLKFYKSFKEKANNERENHLKLIISLIAKAEDLILKNRYDSQQLSSYFLSHLEKAKKLKLAEKTSFKFDSLVKEGSVFKKKFRTSSNPLDLVAMDLYSQLILWNNPTPESYFKNWNIHKELLPYMGLIMEVRSFITNMLNRNNLIQLHDTSYLLKKIIGNDDAPFIYERLGNKIDNYLIDEFQDTSQMQWDVIYPLLNESVSKSHDSLIIGDPKQSIYRFRNAKHTLITETVPESFPEIETSGYTKKDNTNWRSHTNIVKFNNYFFKTLASIVHSLSKDNGIPSNFLDLYSNVVQYPQNQNGKGYVEIRVFDKPDSDNITSDPEDEDEKDWFDSTVTKNLGPLIASLIERGYRQQDIGILVNTNDKGKEVVEAIIKYNASLKKGETKIDFISEESLLVASSPAVAIILNVLEKLSHPIANLTPSESDAENPDSKVNNRFVNWNKMRVNYQLYAMKHPELKPAEAIFQFINLTDFEDSISELLEELTIPSITSIVEAVVRTFMDDTLRKSEALYIASFQDLVNEYSSNYHNDPASFLEWWQSRGSKMSVSTPEGTDAVQIMTIHKSKGLEFKCVIIPFATDSFIPSSQKEEWRWVIPQAFDDLINPPVLPLKTSRDLLGSIHEKYFKEYYDQVMTDRLNMYYVGFTRARNELYIFTKQAGKKTSSIHDFIWRILTGEFQSPECFTEEDSENIISLSDLFFSDNKNIITYGKKLDSLEIEEEYIKNQKKETNKKTVYFKDYYVNKKRPRLRSLASKVSPSGELSR